MKNKTKQEQSIWESKPLIANSFSAQQKKDNEFFGVFPSDPKQWFGRVREPAAMQATPLSK